MDTDWSKQRQQIVAIFFIFVIIFLSYKLLIPYYAYSQFKVDVQKVCNWDRENYLEPPPPEMLKAQVRKIARKRKIPVDNRLINVRIHYMTVIISVKYKVPVDLIVTSFDWEFKFQVQTQEIFD